ncbi:hypothetical protein IV102_17110 [bacterium]|nr:hypothetical protein [bacterium]
MQNSGCPAGRFRKWLLRSIYQRREEMGAEQIASQVEERVVGNAALRVVGRLEAAESEQPGTAG